MYSGLTFTNVSGNLLGVHQKINRAARNQFENITSNRYFPQIKQINHFEGKNGPDGVKTKATYDDVIYHFYDPYDPKDTALIEHIEDHYQQLVKYLKAEDEEKAAFQAAWLAHALVDGLTPAHHYPYEKNLHEIRGDTKSDRKTVKTKLMAQGETTKDLVKKNWLIWGAKGLLTTHGLFEFGVATIMVPVSVKKHTIEPKMIEQAKKVGIVNIFEKSAKRVASEFAYDEFIRRGWTPSLARWVKTDLMPEIVNVVTLAWYLASEEANQ